jgi:hypothetical protein
MSEERQAVCARCVVVQLEHSDAWRALGGVWWSCTRWARTQGTPKIAKSMLKSRWHEQHVFAYTTEDAVAEL